jgi:cell division protein FtsI/penicillin-binding protein 2
MWRRFFIKLRRKNARKYNRDIDPDEIFLDSSNLPKNDVDQFEGRLERPITSQTLISFGIFVCLLILIFLGRVGFLQVWNGAVYAQRSEDNRLRQTLVFAERGVIYDRNNKSLAWNVIDKENPEFAKRAYIDLPGLSSLLGYVKYPMKDKQGFYFSDVLEGKAGLEKFYNNTLSGENGERIVEVNAVGKIQSESTIRLPKNGQNLNLTIDSGLQSKIYETMADLSKRIGFTGGSGVIMDVRDGSLLSMVNFPEYSSQVMTDGSDTKTIKSYLSDTKGKPFLDRA